MPPQITQPKTIANGPQARIAMLEGINQLANAVQVTLGPKGRNVIINNRYQAPIVTKDGVTVADNIALLDDLENAGAQMVREVASRTADAAGDGTTTATVLARAIYAAGAALVSSGSNPMDVKRGIDAAAKVALSYVDTVVRQIEPDSAEVENIGTISANGDREIGSLMAMAIAQVGREGVITVEEGKGLETTLDVVEGMQFDRGYSSPYFMNSETGECIFEGSGGNPDKQPLVLIADQRVTFSQELIKLLESVVKSGRELLIIAEDVEPEVMALLVNNKMQGAFRVCAVQAPGFGDRRRNLLDDIAVLTGGQLITEELGLAWDKLGAEHFGTAKKIVVSRTNTMLVTEPSNDDHKARIELRIAKLRSSLQASELAGYDRDKYRERLAKLTSGVAVIRVGGATETEMKERLYRVEDAMFACKAAVADGIVPGGGITLLRAAEYVDSRYGNLKGSSSFVAGARVLRDALEEPFRQIVRNAGLSDERVKITVLGFATTSTGFDAANEIYTDMFESGIIDPARVVRQEIINASSIAGLLLTTEAVISEVADETTASNGLPLSARQMQQTRHALQRVAAQQKPPRRIVG